MRIDLHLQLQLQVRYFQLIRGLKSELQLAEGPLTRSFPDGSHVYALLRARLRSLVLNLAVESANIKVIGSTRTQKKVHSHKMASISAPGPALTCLPQTIKKEKIRDVFS